MPLSISDLQTIMPNATVTNINKYLSHLNTYMPQFNINSNKRISAFLSQVNVESQALFYTTEIASGAAYEFRTSLGNNQAGDGPKFKGRGLIQITGKDAYRAFSKYVFKDERLLANPTLVATDTSLAVRSACWFWSVYKGNILNAAADSGDFNKVCTTVNGGYNGYEERVETYNRGNQVLGTGIIFEKDQRFSRQDNLASAAKVATSLNDSNLNAGFERIQANIENAETDNVGVTWGSRLTALEESDFIGLKQYLLYLTTKFYPTNLVPFVELIPVYSIDKSKKAREFKEITGVKAIDNLFNRSLDFLNSLDETDEKNTLSNFENNTTFLDNDRFNRTSQQLSNLTEQGGIDLFTIDPFLETTKAFNTPNANGQKIQDERGFGYKIFGTLTLNPSVQGNGLSKAGGVGLKSIEIEAGSQVHHGMSLITVKLLDVQGNKFLDINSPWSFILNSRPGVVGGDFYFRFGWQVRVPKRDDVDDVQAKRFWEHPGWKLFSSLSGEGTDQGDSGEIVKKYISNIADQCDGVITLTQISTLDSMKTPGYMRDASTGSFRIDRQLDILKYMTLTLINPELSVNPEDGSIEATLFFRSNSAVANCLALLNGSGLPVGSNSEPIFETKQLVNTNNSPTLTQLMKAFVNDNKRYITNNSALKNVGNNFNQKSAFLTDFDIKDWLTVIGGAGSDSLIDVNPDNITVKISNDLLKDINEVDKKDSKLLIEWLNLALQENDLTIISAGDKENSLVLSSQTLNGGFIIAYDSEKQKEANNRIVTGKDLSLKDPTFGDFLTYTNFSEGSEQFVGKRLFVQDDVFAFRFQGSLIESINIEKLQQPTETTIQANQAVAGEYGENQNKTDVGNGSVNDNGDQTIHTESKPVTYQTKKRFLNILYSSMLGLNVKCIAHPWLKLCRPVYVKGMGFWDGKYMITKLKHVLSEDNKFITEVNACRILNFNNDNKTAEDTKKNQEMAMNNPKIQKASTVINPIKPNASKSIVTTNFDYPTDNIVVSNVLQSSPIDITPVSEKLRIQLENYIVNLHYLYQNKFREFIKAFERTNSDYRIYITSGYRTWAEQKILKEQNSNNASPGYSMHNYGLACYSEDTEILTDQGWKFFKDLNKTEKIMSFDTEGIMKYEQPIAYISNDYEGEMINFKTRSIDLLVSPNHKMIVKNTQKDRKKKLEKWEFLNAENVTYNYKIPTAGNYIFETELPDYPFKETILPEVWWEFMGWWLSEGSACGVSDNKMRKHSGRFNVTISQNFETREWFLIKDCLDKCGFNYYTVKRKKAGAFVISNKKLHTYLFQLGTKYVKRMPSYLLKGPKNALKKLFWSLLNGDGAHSQRHLIHDKHETYWTVSPGLKDDFSTLCTLLGISHVITETEPVIGVKMAHGKLSKSGVKCYTITTRNKKTQELRNGNGTKQNIIKQFYKGKIYCVTVASGGIVIRRNGKISICGNCDLNLMVSPFRGEQDIAINKSTSTSIWIGTGIVDLARKMGMTWGGTDFGHYKDSVHFGYDNTFDKTTLVAMAVKQFGSDVNLIQGNKLKLIG